MIKIEIRQNSDISKLETQMENFIMRNNIATQDIISMSHAVERVGRLDSWFSIMLVYQQQ